MLQKARREEAWKNSLSRAHVEEELQLKRNWQVGTSLEDGNDFSGVKTY